MSHTIAYLHLKKMYGGVFGLIDRLAAASRRVPERYLTSLSRNARAIAPERECTCNLP